MPTVAVNIKRLLVAAYADNNSLHLARNVDNVDRPSVTPHTNDISTDSLLLCVDLLAIDKTGTDATAAVNINNMQVVLQLPFERCAGDVDVSRENDFAYTMIMMQMKTQHRTNSFLTRTTCINESFTMTWR